MNVKKQKQNKAKALKYDWTLHLNNHSWYAIALNFIGKRGKTNFISCSWWNFLVFISSHRWPVVVCSEGCFMYLTPCDSSPSPPTHKSGATTGSSHPAADSWLVRMGFWRQSVAMRDWLVCCKLAVCCPGNMRNRRQVWGLPGGAFLEETI